MPLDNFIADDKNEYKTIVIWRVKIWAEHYSSSIYLLILINSKMFSGGLWFKSVAYIISIVGFYNNECLQ